MKNLKMKIIKLEIPVNYLPSMYVNGEEINLYNFKYNNEEEYYDIKKKHY